MSRKPIDINAQGVLVSATAASATKALGKARSSFIIVKNIGSNPAFVKTGISTVTSSYPVADTPIEGDIIAAGEITTLSKNASDDYVSFICGAGLSTTLWIKVGEGV